MSKNIGECDGCPKTEVELFVVEKMNLCASCRDKELEAIAASAAETKKFNHVIEQSRKVDNAINIKQDIFNATTVSLVELKAAVDNNPSVEKEKKNYVYMQELAGKIAHLKKVIFDEEAALMEKKNQLHATINHAQQFVAKLREDERAKYKQFDINYTPSSPTKSIKTTKPTGPKKSSGTKFDKTALYEAAKKYNVPAPQVQSLVLSRNLSYEDAAKEMAKILGLI